MNTFLTVAGKRQAKLDKQSRIEEPPGQRFFSSGRVKPIALDSGPVIPVGRRPLPSALLQAEYKMQANPETTTTTRTDEGSVDVEELKARVEALSKKARKLQEGHEELCTEVEELREENQELRTQVKELDSRTDLLQLVESSDELTGKQRSVALIQNLRRAARKKLDNGRSAKASLNREEAERALHYPDVDRTTIYSDLRRAVRLVGNEDILWYESRTSGESRLKLNLENGELPDRFNGEHEVA